MFTIFQLQLRLQILKVTDFSYLFEYEINYLTTIFFVCEFAFTK